MKLTIKQVKNVIGEAMAPDIKMKFLSSSTAHRHFPDAFSVQDEDDPAYMPEYDDMPAIYFVAGGILHAYQNMDLIDCIWTGTEWVERMDSISPYADLESEDYEDEIDLQKIKDPKKREKAAKITREKQAKNKIADEEYIKYLKKVQRNAPPPIINKSMHDK